MSDKTWDERYMGLSRHIAEWSKDRSTKVGAVIVGPDNEPRSMGYNGFPRNVDDDVEERHERPVKYKFTEHAERNAVYNAARVGIPLKGCRIYVPWIPCSDCARAIIQSGITEIVTDNIDVPERWRDDFLVALELLDEAGILIRFPNSKKKIRPRSILDPAGKSDET